MRVFSIIAAAIMVCVVCAGCSDPMGDALSLEKSGDWEGALMIYQSVLAENPDDLEALSGTATALWLVGRYDEAMPFQEKVVAVDPGDLQTTLELAFNYLNHQGRASDAVDLIEQARTYEASGRILTYLGLAKRELGDLTGAEESFREALVTEPGYGLAYYELTRLLQVEGRTEEAAAVREAAEKNGIDLGEGL